MENLNCNSRIGEVVGDFIPPSDTPTLVQPFNKGLSKKSCHLFTLLQLPLRGARNRRGNGLKPMSQEALASPM